MFASCPVKVPDGEESAQEEQNLQFRPGMELEDDNLNEDNYDDISFLPKRHFFLKSCGVLVIVTALGGIIWGLAEIPKNWYDMTYAGSREPTDIRPRTALSLRDGGQNDPAKIIGTSGTTETATPPDAQAVQQELRDVDAITRNQDDASLVGRRVQVHLPIEEPNSTVAYWVGPPDNPLLVILHRDVRDGFARMASVPPAHGIQPLKTGQVATVSGTIQPLPSFQDQFSWDLTRGDRQRLAKRGIYLLADRVQTDTTTN